MKRRVIGPRKMVEQGAPLYVALVHHPVMNRKGEVISSAITNLDLHDMARTACTYSVPVCYIVTPLMDQQALSQRLIDHWRVGIGKQLAPDRERALSHLRVIDSIEEACADIRAAHGESPLIWITSARNGQATISCREARTRLEKSSRPCLLLFGTGWGLAAPVVESADAILEPIEGRGDYNHLSVRCAAAIILDRLLSRID